MKHWSPLETVYLTQGIITKTPYKVLSDTLARSPKAIELKVRRMKHNLVRRMHLRDLIGMWALINAPRDAAEEQSFNVQ